MRGRFLLVLGLCAHLLFGLVPAWEKVRSAPNGRDFASYYYAYQVAADGGDPYETPSLDAAARKDRTRRDVHPYFYPPPFLLTMAWVRPLTLPQAYAGMLVVNEALLLATAVLCVRAFSVAPWAMALLLAGWSSIPDNATMGQANLFALVPALAGLALVGKRPIVGGVLVGVAAMLKMSPALFLVYFALHGRWRAIGAAVTTAVLLSVATLPLVGLDAQLRFYTEVLPSFSSGDYHGLGVPISLPANHSIPDLFNTAFPGPDKHHLSAVAQHASLVVTLLLLGIWAFRFRGPPVGDPDPFAVAALTVLMVIVPVYTYEHHLVFLLLAAGVALSLRPGIWSVLAVATIAWPLDSWKAAMAAVPAVAPLVRESKFLAELGLFALLCAGPRRPR